MSGFDANFRNTGSGNLNSFAGDGNARGGGNVLNIPPVLLPFMALACGTTTTWVLQKQVGFTFFRTTDLKQNLKYNARQGNFVIDFAGPVDITVTARGFTPFVSLVRNNSVSAQATDGSGIVTHTVTADETGPWTVEVTSVEPYATGDFDIQISCAPGFKLEVDKTNVIVGEKVTYTVTVTPPAVYVVNFTLRLDDGLTLQQVTTNSSGVGVLESGYAGLNLFGLKPAALTGAVTVTAGVVSAPTLFDSKVLNITDPGSFACQAFVDYLNVIYPPGGWTSPMTGSMKTYGPGSNIAYGPGPIIEDGLGILVLTSLGIPGVTGYVTYNKTNDSYGVMCPRGVYTLVSDPLGTAPATVTVT